MRTVLSVLTLGLAACASRELPPVSATSERAPPAAETAAGAFVNVCLKGVIAGHSASDMMAFNEVVELEDKAKVLDLGFLLGSERSPFNFGPSDDELNKSLLLRSMSGRITKASDVRPSLYRSVGRDGVVEMAAGRSDLYWCSVRLYDGDPEEAERIVTSILRSEDGSFRVEKIGGRPALRSGVFEIEKSPGVAYPKTRIHVEIASELGDPSITFSAFPDQGEDRFEGERQSQLRDQAPEDPTL